MICKEFIHETPECNGVCVLELNHIGLHACDTGARLMHFDIVINEKEYVSTPFGEVPIMVSK